MEVLKVQNVVKRFGDYAASNNVSFSVEAGKIFGLLGPNGAGKTTQIRMITNILMPDEGSIEVFGAPVTAETQSRIGYLPEERGLYKRLKVIEQLVYFAQLKGISKHEATERAHYWLEKTGAAGWESKKIQELSKGMQQKVQFISTILHEPDFLILDEPFSGFDPINTELLKNIILELRDKGKTVILSTHVMSQVEELCDDICMINKGEVVLHGSVDEIKSRYGKNNVLLEYKGDSAFIKELSDIEVVNQTNHRVEFKIKSETTDRRALIDFINNKIEIQKFEFARPSMHEIFIEIVASQGRK